MMSISLVSPNQNFLQMLQYSGRLANSAYPMMNTTQMITGNTVGTSAGLIDEVNFAVPGANTLSNLLATSQTSQSNLNSLFNQLA
jgi:hypothetical protein